MKFVFGRHFTPSPLFNETLHFVKLCIFPRLESFGVMQDKSVVTAMKNTSIDVGFSGAIMRDFLVGRSASTKRTWCSVSITAFSTPKILLINDDFPHPV
jgi:hypothetical protein